MALLRDQGSGGEPVVYGQSSSARDQSGVATSSVDFAAKASINYDMKLQVRRRHTTVNVFSVTNEHTMASNLSL